MFQQVTNAQAELGVDLAVENRLRTTAGATVLADLAADFLREVGRITDQPLVLGGNANNAFVLLIATGRIRIRRLETAPAITRADFGIKGVPRAIDKATTKAERIAGLVLEPGKAVLLVGADIEEIVGAIVTELPVQLVLAEIALRSALVLFTPGQGVQDFLFLVGALGLDRIAPKNAFMRRIEVAVHGIAFRIATLEQQRSSHIRRPTELVFVSGVPADTGAGNNDGQRSLVPVHLSLHCSQACVWCMTTCGNGISMPSASKRVLMASVVSHITAQ